MVLTLSGSEQEAGLKRYVNIFIDTQKEEYKYGQLEILRFAHSFLLVVGEIKDNPHVCDAIFQKIMYSVLQ